MKKMLWIFFLIFFDIFIWSSILFGRPNKNLELYFLNVGQGDSELIKLPGDVKILMDGGPNQKFITELSKSIAPTDRYIDLVILSHAEADHFTGLIEVAKRYQIGTFIFNGINNKTDSWLALIKILKDKNVPILVLSAGDRIKYLNTYLNFLWPEKNNLPNITKSLNESTLIAILENESGGQKTKALFMGDAGFKTENQLLKKYNLDADILKVGHHGSKYSTSDGFLKEVSPKISVIEVGKNSYGHPTKETLSRLTSVHSTIFRTDKDGIIKIVAENGELSIYKSN